MTVDEAFDASAAYYDGWVKKALPNYDELFGIAVELIPFSANEAIHVLDLGAGTGLFSWHVLQKHPSARFMLLDLASKLLRIAESRFQGLADQFRYEQRDYRLLDYTADFDLVISSVSIHHLEDTEKRHLFNRINQALRSGGVFINVDQIRGPSPRMRELYWSNWLQTVQKTDATEKEIRNSIGRRTEFDHDALLVDQLEWLSDAGFVDVDCVYKNWFIGVFFAAKP